MTSRKKPVEAEKNKGGRPPKFKTAQALQKAIDAYFDACDPHWEVKSDWVKKRTRAGKLIKDAHGQDQWVELEVRKLTDQQPYTVSGLARSLGMSRQALIDYGDKAEFLDTVEAAKERCHEFAEAMLFSNTSSGAAFSLKNNWGWRDKQEVDHTSMGEAIAARVEFIGGGPAEPSNG